MIYRFFGSDTTLSGPYGEVRLRQFGQTVDLSIEDAELHIAAGAPLIPEAEWEHFLARRNAVEAAGMTTEKEH